MNKALSSFDADMGAQVIASPSMSTKAKQKDH